MEVVETSALALGMEEAEHRTWKQIQNLGMDQAWTEVKI